MRAHGETVSRAAVIGITGSTGKTTTKNLVRDVLVAAGSVCATKGNQNNELGVPNTVLAAQADTRNVIVEMGMRGLHQLEELCGFVRPQWGLVTNVGESHIELLGSRENIARAKAELLEALPAGGMAFVNAANDMTPKLLEFADLDSRGVTCASLRWHRPGRRAPCDPFRRRRGASCRVVRGRAP